MQKITEIALANWYENIRKHCDLNNSSGSKYVRDISIRYS